MIDFLLILLCIVLDLGSGLMMYSIFNGDSSDGTKPLFKLEKFKRPYRVLIRLSFIVFWWFYVLAMVLVSLYDVTKGTFKSILE